MAADDAGHLFYRPVHELSRGSLHETCSITSVKINNVVEGQNEKTAHRCIRFKIVDLQHAMNETLSENWAGAMQIL